MNLMEDLSTIFLMLSVEGKERKERKKERKEKHVDVREE